MPTPDPTPASPPPNELADFRAFVARDDVPDEAKQQAADAFAKQYPPPGGGAFVGERSTPDPDQEAPPSPMDVEVRRGLTEPWGQIKDGLHALLDAHQTSPTDTMTDDLKEFGRRSVREVQGLFAPLQALYGATIQGPAEIAGNKAGLDPQASRMAADVLGVGASVVSPETLASKIPFVGERAASALSKVPLLRREAGPLEVGSGETLEGAVRRTAGIGDETAQTSAQALGARGPGGTPPPVYGALDRAVKTPVQNIYDKVRTWADQNGVTAGGQAHQTLMQNAAGLTDMSGLNAAQRDVLTRFQQDVAKGIPPAYGQMEDWKQEFDRAFRGESSPKAPPAVQDAYQLKWQLRNAMRDSVSGSQAPGAAYYRDRLEEASDRWRTEVIPAENVANDLTAAADPRNRKNAADVLNRIARDPQRLRAAQQLLSKDPDLAGHFVGGVVGNMLEGADPLAAVAKWEKLPREGRAILAQQNPALPTLFDAMKRVKTTQGAVSNRLVQIGEGAFGVFLGAHEGVAGAMVGFGVPIAVEQIAKSRIATNLIARGLLTDRNTPAAIRVASQLAQVLKDIGASTTGQSDASDQAADGR